MKIFISLMAGVFLLSMINDSKKQNDNHIPPDITPTVWVYDQGPEHLMLNLMNGERERALTLNNDLSGVAKRHADNMIRTGVFSHIINGRTPQDRVRDAGLCEPDTIVSENIGMVSGSIDVQGETDDIFIAFEESKGHAENIRDPRWTCTGIAYSVDSKNQKIYWVIVFANKVATPFRIMPFPLSEEN